MLDTYISGLCLRRFDGDGMLHACRIKGGKVSYCNRYVVTARLVRERSLGFPIYMRVSDQTAVAGCVVLLAGAVCTGDT